MTQNSREYDMKLAIYTEELSMAYAAAGRVLQPDMIGKIAQSLVEAIKCRVDEIKPMFETCKNSAPIPTQMALQKALLQWRAAKPQLLADALPKQSSKDMTLEEYEQLTGDYRIRNLAHAFSEHAKMMSVDYIIAHTPDRKEAV